MVRRSRLMVTAVVLAAVVAACGGDESAPETSEADPPAATGSTADTGAATTTPAVSTTIAPATTATTTTAPPPTTAPADVHPVLGIEWMEPPEGLLGVFGATTYDGREVEVEATLEHGVEWAGGTWSRVTIGDLAPGSDGGALYVDLSEPWSLRIGGLAATFGNAPDTFEEGRYHDPFVIEVDELLTGPVFMETIQTYTLGDFTIDQTLTLEASLHLIGNVAVPAGEFDVITLRLEFGGEYIGGTDLERTLTIDGWYNPEVGIVGISEFPAFLDVGLLEVP